MAKKKALKSYITKSRKQARVKYKQTLRPLTKYVAIEFTPYILGYGIILNIPTNHFLGLEISSISIVSHGLTWYFFKEELMGEIIGDIV